jgi:hypothetical protein
MVMTFDMVENKPRVDRGARSNVNEGNGLD